MSGYTDVWTRDEDLDSLQLRIHDGKPLLELADRAHAYRCEMFEHLFPNAAPGEGDRVLEVGSGVGWIMQGMIEAYPTVEEVVGLDISENMIRRAQERWTHARARWELYDGLHFPFPDGHFQVVYSCAALQHVEKHHAFFIFKEIQRVLAPGGHAVLHLMPTQMMHRNPTTFEQECRNHIENRTDTHWHHYYSFEELVGVFSNVIEVDDLDLQTDEDRVRLYVHFSKGTGSRFLHDSLPDIALPDRAEERQREAATQVAELTARLREMESSKAWRLAVALRRRVRQLAPVGTRRGTAVSNLTGRLNS
jgi:ubiquinone/menaquinone biosynthesis C-methylase UbiE